MKSWHHHIEVGDAFDLGRESRIYSNGGILD